MVNGGVVVHKDPQETDEEVIWTLKEYSKQRKWYIREEAAPFMGELQGGWQSTAEGERTLN